MRNPLRIIEKNRQIRTFQSEIPEIPDFRRTHRSLCKTPVPFPQIPIEMKANKHAETPKTTYPWTRTSFVHVLQARFTIISFLSPRSIRPEHFPVEKFISSFCSAARRQFGIHLPDEIADQVHGFAHSQNFTLEKAKVQKVSSSLGNRLPGGGSFSNLSSPSSRRCRPRFSVVLQLKRTTRPEENLSPGTNYVDCFTPRSNRSRQ